MRLRVVRKGRVMKKLASALSLSVVALGVSALVGGCGGKVVFETGGDGGAGGTTQSSTQKGTSVTTAISGTAVSGTSVVSSGTGLDGSASVSQAVGSTGSGTACFDSCKAMFPQGVPALEHRVVRECGCHMQSPCIQDCFMTGACAPMGPPPQGQCATCIDQQTPADACYQIALSSPQCNNNPDCAQIAQCILACP